MRITSTDVPRRPLGLRGWLIGAAVALVVLFLSFRGLARFYTDYLWFKEVGFSSTWRRLLSAKFVPAAIFSSIFFVVMLTNLIVADRLAPRYRSAAGPEDEIIERYRTYVAPYSGRLRVVVAIFFALVMGGGVSAEWRNWILFSNAVKVPGPGDPQFHKNIGFYLFRLPFIQFAVGWTFAALLVVLIVTAVFHYLNGGIRLQSPWQRVTPQVKVHLSVILALMALTKTAQYFYARYELVFSRRGVIDGAGYTDVKAQLPALNLLMVISVFAAGLFIANIFRRGWVFPIIAVGLWGFISLVVGTIYPAIVQRVNVQPNELSKEAPYIERNIAATRTAFGLDKSKVTVKTFNYAEDLDQNDVTASTATLANTRLWGPDELALAISPQKGPPYYKFGDVDVDRYGREGENPPDLLAPRELDPDNIPDRTWTNRHLVYTAGCGAVVAAGNEEQGGDPRYLLQNIPPTGDLASELKQPLVYFGEGAQGYVVVDTKVSEQGCSQGDEKKTTRYTGSAGVAASSFLRKAALAVRFNDWNLLVSGQLHGSSRVLYRRDVRERVRTAAPFLKFDADPYPVIVGGRMLWVVDAYTVSSRYPYSQALHPRSLPDGSGLDTEFNYVRNSVKATVDAYDGTIHFYVVDKTDPIIEVYQKAFPDLFDAVKDMPDGLREHWRYPEDLFRAQTEQFSLYHMTDTEDFYKKRFLWDVSPAPDDITEVSGNVATETTSGGNNGGRNTTLAAGQRPADPLYITTKLPDEKKEEFVLQRPFVPRSNVKQLAGFMYARIDGDNYGKLVVYQVPQDKTVPSPPFAAAAMKGYDPIANAATLLGQQKSSLDFGSLQLIAIKDSILYLQPIYVRGAGTGTIPRVRFVAVAYGDGVALVDFQQVRSDRFRTIQDAVNALVAGTAPTGSTGNDNGNPENPNSSSTTTTTNPGPTTPTTQGALPDTLAELLALADREFQAADEALKSGAPDALAQYQQHIANARAAIARAEELQATPSTTTTTAPVNA